MERSLCPVVALDPGGDHTPAMCLNQPLHGAAWPGLFQSPAPAAEPGFCGRSHQVQDLKFPPEKGAQGVSVSRGNVSFQQPQDTWGAVLFLELKASFGERSGLPGGGDTSSGARVAPPEGSSPCVTRTVLRLPCLPLPSTPGVHYPLRGTLSTAAPSPHPELQQGPREPPQWEARVFILQTPTEPLPSGSRGARC